MERKNSIQTRPNQSNYTTNESQNHITTQKLTLGKFGKQYFD